MLWHFLIKEQLLPLNFLALLNWIEVFFFIPIVRLLGTVVVQVDPEEYPGKKEKQPDIILRLLTDDLFYSKIMIRYLDRLKEIIPKVIERFPVPKKVLEELLLGKATLISMLESQPDLIKQSRALIETLDFINRRKLLV